MVAHEQHEHLGVVLPMPSVCMTGVVRGAQDEIEHVDSPTETGTASLPEVEVAILDRQGTKIVPTVRVDGQTGASESVSVISTKALKEAAEGWLLGDLVERSPLWDTHEGRETFCKRALETLHAERDRVLAEKAQKAEEKGADGTGASALFPAVEPWPVSVELADVLDGTAGFIRQYLAADLESIDAAALWAALTWRFKDADISPRLQATSPTPRCGKSTLFALLREVVRRPLSMEGVSASALFRLIETYEPTLLLDEADSFMKEDEDLRGVVNSGHARGGQMVRCVGDDHEPQTFATFAPVGLAGIGRLARTIEDRSVRIVLRRKRPTDRVQRVRRRTIAAQAEDLRAQFARWAADTAGSPLEVEDDELPQGLHDRAADSWEGMLAIAHLAGRDWPERAYRAALALSGGGDAETSEAAVRLLADLKTFFEAEGGRERASSAAVLAYLNGIEDAPWGSWCGGQPMRSRQLWKLLDGFEIKSRSVRMPDGSTPKGLHRADLDDPWSRYLPETPPQSATSATSLPGKDLRQNPIRHTLPSVADENGRKCLLDKAVADVADSDPLPGRDHLKTGDVADAAAPEDSLAMEAWE